jgi:serine/threonine protein kinase
MEKQFILTDIAKTICSLHNYHFGKEVGKGGFKETFEIADPLGNRYALKIYFPDKVNDRIIREIEAMTRCESSGIAKVLSVNNTRISNQNYVYSIEEYLSGGTLKDKISNGLLPSDELIDLGNQLFSTIKILANKNLVHRDLKPDNILYREDHKTIVVTDFGIVRDLSAESLTESWFSNGPGTPGFAAPEQLRNEKHFIDWRTDQFSCGILLAISGIGIHPYANPDDKLEQILERMYKRISPTQYFINQATHNGLSILCKMVSPWPIHRYRTPDDLINHWQLIGGKNGRIPSDGT